ncbi:TRAF family member-associated NF-kappa-B activator-like [Pelodytes ibericus]
MEDAFLLLYQEFQVLQSVCRKQAELLQKLLSKKGASTEIPVTKPIQCSDLGDHACSESPSFRLLRKENTDADSSNPVMEELPTSKPLKPKEDSSVLLDFDVRFPPGREQYSYLSSENEKVELAVGTSNANSTNDFELFIKNYTPQFSNMTGSGDKGICETSKAELEFLLPVNTDPNFSLSHSYENLCYLQSTDISLGECLAPEIRNPIGIRGPTQSSWSPGCLSEEYQHGCHVDINSDVGLSSQICDFCQAIFPAGAATKGEYLRHLTGHVE